MSKPLVEAMAELDAAASDLKAALWEGRYWFAAWVGFIWFGLALATFAFGSNWLG